MTRKSETTFKFKFYKQINKYQEGNEQKDIKF